VRCELASHSGPRALSAISPGIARRRSRPWVNRIGDTAGPETKHARNGRAVALLTSRSSPRRTMKLHDLRRPKAATRRGLASVVHRRRQGQDGRPRQQRAEAPTGTAACRLVRVDQNPITSRLQAPRLQKTVPHRRDLNVGPFRPARPHIDRPNRWHGSGSEKGAKSTRPAPVTSRRHPGRSRAGTHARQAAQGPGPRRRDQAAVRRADAFSKTLLPRSRRLAAPPGARVPTADLAESDERATAVVEEVRSRPRSHRRTRSPPHQRRPSPRRARLTKPAPEHRRRLRQCSIHAERVPRAGHPSSVAVRAGDSGIYRAWRTS